MSICDVQSMAVNPTPGVMLPQSGDTPRTRLLLGATTESSSGAVRAEATPHTAQQTAQVYSLYGIANQTLTRVWEALALNWGQASEEP